MDLQKLHYVLSKLDVDQSALNGRIVLITGAARGIGESLAHAVSTYGATVILVDVLADGASVADRIRSSNGSAHFYKVDLSDRSAASRAIGEMLDKYGRIDVLVNNASRLVPVSIMDSTPGSWEEPYRIVIEAAAIFTSKVLPGMLERGDGTIANTIAAEGLSFAAPFSSAMVGNRSMVLSLAGELPMGQGVNVFGFAPGLTDTRLAHNYIDGASKKQDISPEEWISKFAHNPGYDGLMPAEDCAAALCYSLSHARSLHGQITDAFHPLAEAGVIAPSGLDGSHRQDSSIGISNTVGQIGEYVRGIASVNRNLEIRIAERTRELQDVNAQLADQKRSVEHLSSVLARYLPEQVYQSIFQGNLAEGVSSRRRFLTILFSDIAGFTSKAENLEPEALSDIINLYFSEMTEIARTHGATIDKFIGDAILAFFGDPNTDGLERDAEKCVTMAIDMQRRLRELRGKFERLGLHEPLEVRIGINSGYCTVGNFGSFERMDYTILGRPVNIAARLQSACSPGSILVSRNTKALIEDRFTLSPFGQLSLKGVGGKIETFEVSHQERETEKKASADDPISELADQISGGHFDNLKEDEKRELLTTLTKLVRR